MEEGRPEEPRNKVCGGFRSFSSADWKRIETLSPHTREVGRMMQEEGIAVVSGVSLQHPIRTGCCPEHYRRMCDFFKLKTLVASGPSPVRSRGKAAGRNVRHQVEERLRQQDQERIADLHRQFPRWGAVQNRWEWYVVAFRRWFHSSSANAFSLGVIDRLQSCRNLLALLPEDFAPGQDLKDDLEAACAGFTFTGVLLSTCQHEDAIAAPSLPAGLTGLALYPEQKDLARRILARLRERLRALAANDSAFHFRSGLIRFCTPPSTGKSSAAAYIGAALYEFLTREAARDARAGRKQKLTDVFVVYECYSENVRFDVAKACVGAGVPFAIFTAGVASPSFSCYHNKAPRKDCPPVCPVERLRYNERLLTTCDLQPAVLIMDPASAEGFLKSRSHRQTDRIGDILLFDEPISSLSAAVAQAHARLMALAPAHTVFMSATLPSLQELQRLNPHLQAFEGLDICSRRVTSPCTVVDAEGVPFAPHRLWSGCVGELAEKVSAHLHLYRLYSPRALAQLVDDLPQTEERAQVLLRELQVWDALDFESVRRTAQRLLRACDPKLRMGARVATYRYFNVATICTSGAHMLPGVTMFLAEDADELRKEALPALLRGAEKLGRRLELVAAAQNRAPKLRVHESSTSKQCKEKVSQLARQKEVEQRREAAPPPPVLWPPHLCVNTVEHVRQHGFSRIDFGPYRASVFPPEDVQNSSNEDLVESVLSGVCPLDSIHMDRSLALSGQVMADAKAFSFLFGGRANTYGTNLPCDRVVLLLDPNRTDPDIIVQSLGRCGRTGKSTKAEVTFGCPELLDKVFLPA